MVHHTVALATAVVLRQSGSADLPGVMAALLPAQAASACRSRRPRG